MVEFDAIVEFDLGIANLAHAAPVKCGDFCQLSQTPTLSNIAF